MPRTTERYPAGTDADPVCPVCGRHFAPDNARAVYCSRACKQSADFRRYYIKNQIAIRARIQRNRKGKGK